MTDWMIFLAFAAFGIIGYVLMGRIGQSIDRHAAGGDYREQEKRSDEYADHRESKRAHPRMPFFLNLQHKSHSRSF